MIAKKVIIHGINAKSNIVSKARCGITVPAENSVAIAQACITIKNMSKAERTKFGTNGRKYAMKNHTYQDLARKFEYILGKN